MKISTEKKAVPISISSALSFLYKLHYAEWEKFPAPIYLLWGIPVPNDCSWSWRKLLNLRDTFHPVGNGKGTFLWFDNRHPLGPIVQKYSSRICYDTAIPVYAKVNTIIEENGWKWPAVRSFNRPPLRFTRASLPLESTQELLDWLATGRFERLMESTPANYGTRLPPHWRKSTTNNKDKMNARDRKAFFETKEAYVSSSLIRTLWPFAHSYRDSRFAGINRKNFFVDRKVACLLSACTKERLRLR